MEYEGQICRAPMERGSFMLPVMVGDQLKQHALEVSVLRSADKWFGMTYHEDREIVAEELRKLHDSGAYPESLQV